jgi:hypothetical protein
MPEEGDIGLRESTGSCWLVLSVKPSRKGDRWRTMQVEGLGVGAAEVGDEGVFTFVPMSPQDELAAQMVENGERLGEALGSKDRPRWAEPDGSDRFPRGAPA